MSLSEFEIIARFFTGATRRRDDVLLGIGDDCALLSPPADDQVLVVTVDTLVEGRHFTQDADPEALGHKCLAVNLSDLAAMGATPAWVTLALTLPDANPNWLAAFMHGFTSLAGRYGVALVGGDTTRGPLSVTVQALGSVGRTQALRREGAAPGDRIYVSGSVGDAALALTVKQGLFESETNLDRLNLALERPEPRVQVGRRLRGLASAAIDLSDGLVADLTHVCESSGVGATIVAEQVPVSQEMAAYIAATEDWSLALNGGDDYELCFTVAPDREHKLADIATRLDVALTCIGQIEKCDGVRVVHAQGDVLNNLARGFDHFRSHD